jgi:hypothetical protein
MNGCCYLSTPPPLEPFLAYYRPASSAHAIAMLTTGRDDYMTNSLPTLPPSLPLDLLIDERKSLSTNLVLIYIFEKIVMGVFFF